jgi:Flp pilus assembly protein TadG
VMRGQHGERGSTSVVETVLIAPVLFAIVMMIVQFALVAHARSVAEAAAQEGASAGRAVGGNSEAARARADRYISSLGPRMLADRRVDVEVTDESVTVTVRGDVVSLVPWVTPSIAETASGPRERYVPPEP